MVKRKKLKLKIFNQISITVTNKIIAFGASNSGTY